MVLEKDPLTSERAGRPKLPLGWASIDARSRWIIALSLVFVIFAYLPTLQFDYVTQDQWRAFRYSTAEMTPAFRADSCLHAIPSFYVLTGRPLVWPTECLEHTVVGRISDFAYLRPIILLIALATVLYLGWVLTPILGSLGLGVMAASIFVFSPGYSFMFLQGMTGAMVLLSVVAAAASFHALRPLLDRIFSRDRPHSAQFARPLIFFLIGCFIYPVWTFLVLPLSLLEFGFDRENPFWHRSRKLIGYAAFYLSGSVIYYGFVKLSSFALLKILKNYTLDPNYQVKMQLDISTLAARFIQLWKVFYNIDPSNLLIGAGFSTLVVAGFALYAGFRPVRFTIRGTAIAACVALSAFAISIIVLLGSISPWLFSRMNSPNTFFMAPWYLFFATAAVGILYAIIAKLPGRFNAAAPYVLLVALVVPTAAEQNKISYAQALVSDYEIWAMARGLDQWVDAKGYETRRYLLVVLPRDVFPVFPVKYMFGNADLEENAVLSSSQNPVSIPWMVNSLLRRHPGIANSISIIDCGSDQNCANYKLHSTKSVVLGATYGEVPIVAAQQPFVIDLSRLTAHPAHLRIQIARGDLLPNISASSQLGPYGPQGLLWNVEPGWHAAPPASYPQTLTFDFDTKKHISRIGFLPQDNLSIRAPKNVRIETSSDGKTWHADEPATDLACSAKGDYRYLQLASPVETQYLRIDILKNCGDPTYLTLRGLKFE